MILNLGSLAFNVNIESGGGTPAWGTELGQGEGYKFVFEDMSDFFTGMVYKSVSDIDTVTCPLGKGGNQRADYDFVIASVFDKIYVNGKLVKGGRFLLLVVKKLNGDHHVGRRTIKYNPRMTYHGEYINDDCYRKMAHTMGLTENAAWFVYEIFIENQDELHFTAFELGKNPQSYRSTDERKNAFISKLPKGDKHTCLSENPSNRVFQQIFYGAPGTGKSNQIKRIVDDQGKKCFRTTFHPDSDYSTFVGCYKPSMKPTGVTLASKEKEEVITYKFIPQAFTRAYVEAWKTEEDVFLVIEEINRGNCAQIFGDLFQLLDRKDGVSEYPIDADTDLAAYLSEALAISQRKYIPIEVKSGERLMLPANLYIWATMNTSDQSLFPIDSAFKRRWDWKYIPIDTKKEKWSIEADGTLFSWSSFLDYANGRIEDANHSEDKMLGFYFCKATKKENENDDKPTVITADTFVSKVLFYLWNDVFKDFSEGESVFPPDMPFRYFFKSNGDVDEPRVAELLIKREIEVSGELETTEEDEDGNSELSTSKDYSKYSVNGTGNYGKNRLATECVKEYVKLNPGLTAAEVLAEWKTLGNIVSHFVESKEVYEARTDSSKRSSEVKCSDDVIYVAHNGYGSNGKVELLIEKVNGKPWGVTVQKL